MSKLIGDQEIKKKKEKPIQISHEAEEVQRKLKAPEMDPLKDPNGPFMQKESRVIKDEEANPLIRREIRRRLNENKDRPDDIFEGMIKDINNNDFFSAEKKAEKSWVSGKLDDYTKKTQERQRLEREKEEADRLKQEEDRLKQEQEAEELRKAGEKYVETHSNEYHSKRFAAIARRGLFNERGQLKVNTLKYVPKKSAMIKDFKAVFSEKVTQRSRALKMRNKRSRLFQKIKNANMVGEAFDKYSAEVFTEMEKTMSKQAMFCDEADYNDLAQFMIKGKDEENLEIISKYLGKSKKRGPGGYEGQDAQAALDLMVKQLFAIDINSLHLESDTDIAKNAGTLERLSNQLAAFDRMAQKHGYDNNLNPQEKKILEKKMDSLRTIANYYFSRKDIMQDKYYKEHYDEELSMDVLAGKSEEQRVIAEKLVRSFVLGRTMMRINGVDIRRLQAPTFRNPDSKGIFDNINEEYNTRKAHRIYTDKAYRLINEKSRAYFTTSKARYDEAEKMASVHARKDELVQKTEDNLMAHKGNPLFDINHQDEAFSDEKFEGYIKEIEEMDVSKMKVSSYTDLIEHFSENKKIMERVDVIRHNISRGLIRGKKIPDERLLEIRAKLIFYSEIALTMFSFNSSVLLDPDLLDKSDEEKNKFLLNRAIGMGRIKKNTLLYPGAPADLLKKCRDTVREEYDSREETIKATWKSFNSRYIKGDKGKKDSIKEPGKMPKEELERRKAEYLSNMTVYDSFLDQNTKSESGGWNYENAIIKHYCKKNGKEFKALPRTVYSFCIGKSADEVLRIYKLFSEGTKGDQFNVWKEIEASFYKIPIKEYDSRDMGTWYDNYQKKAAMSLVVANYNDVYSEMKNLMEDPATKGWLKLPSKFKNMDDFEKQIMFRSNFSQSYVSGRYNGLTQIEYSKYIGTYSVKEYGNFDDEYLDNLENLKSYFEMYGDFESEEENSINAYRDRTMFICQERAGKKLSPGQIAHGEVKRRARFDNDIEELYKEEERLYELQQEKVKVDKLKKAYEGPREEMYNFLIAKANADPKWEEIHNKLGTNSGFVRRMRAMTYMMSAFKKDSKDRSWEMFCNLMIDSKKASTELKQTKAVEFERLFDFIMQYDVKKFNFKKPADLFSMDRLDNCIFGGAMWDFETAVIDEYVELMKDDKVKCKYDENMIKELRARRCALQTMQTWQAAAFQLGGQSLIGGKTIEELLPLTEDEMFALQEKPEDGMQVGQILYIQDAYKQGFGPGLNAEKILEKERKNAGLA